MSATAGLLADLGMEVITAPTEDPGAFVVVLVLGDVHEDETSAELVAEEIHARLSEAIETDLTAPLRVSCERLALS